MGGCAATIQTLGRLFEVRDAAASLLALYLSIWLYEVGNWVSLSAEGAKVTFLLSGVLPVGVMGVGAGGTGFPLAKLAQVALCSTATLLAAWVARSKGFRLAGATLLGITGMNIASVYWEMLWMMSFIPVAFNEAIYLAMSAAIAWALLRAVPGNSVMAIEARPNRLA